MLHYFYSLECGILVYLGDVMGRIGKGQVCSVKNCDEEAVRSVNPEKAKTAGLDVEGYAGSNWALAQEMVADVLDHGV